MENTFEAQIQALTVQAREARDRFTQLEGHRQHLVLEALNIEADMNRSLDIRVIQKHATTLARSKATLKEVADMAGRAQTALISIEAQIKALEVARIRDENLKRTAEWVLHGVALREEFDAALIEMEAAFLAGYKRLDAKREEQRAARQQLERAILTIDPSLAHRFAATTTEQNEDVSKSYAFRRAIAEHGVDERSLSIALRGENEPRPPALLSLSNYDSAPERVDGLAADILKQLREAREAVKYGRPSPLLSLKVASATVPVNSFTAPMFLGENQLAPFPDEPTKQESQEIVLPDLRSEDVPWAHKGEGI